MNGNQIESIQCGGGYAVGKVWVTTKKGELMLIKVEELLPLMQKQEYVKEMKKKYYHLTLKK